MEFIYIYICYLNAPLIYDYYYYYYSFILRNIYIYIVNCKAKKSYILLYILFVQIERVRRFLNYKSRSDSDVSVRFTN